jgi:hypothetical protein
VSGIIRQKWNYQGVIITDDLVMGAIYNHNVCTAVLEALNASVDLLCCWSLSMVRNSIASSRARLTPLAKEGSIRRLCVTARDGCSGLSRQSKRWLGPRGTQTLFPLRRYARFAVPARPKDRVAS